MQSQPRLIEESIAKKIDGNGTTVVSQFPVSGLGY